MSESVKITIEAEDKASAALAATAKIYKDNIARSIELNNAAMTAEERHASAVRHFQTDLVKGIITRETYNRLIAQSAKSNDIEAESTRRARIEVEKYERSQRLLAEAKKRSASVQPENAKVGGGGSLGGLLKGGSKNLFLAGVTKYGVPAALALGTKYAIQLAAGVEVAQVAFEVLTGSAEKASKMIAEMKALDARSPLSFIDIQQAGKTLLGYGVTAENVMGSLEKLGDISMGNADKFNSLSLAFGQVKAAGRLMGQENLQMINAGFAPLATIADDLAKKFGGLSEDYMPRLKKQMEEGKISFKMFEDAIASATSGTGRFANMNERISKTTSGAYAKMISDVQKLGVEAGNVLLPAASLAANIGGLVARTNTIPFKLWSDWVKLQGEALYHAKETTKEIDKQVTGQKKLNALTAEQKKHQETVKAEKQNRVAFKDERADFNSQLKQIDDEYRKKMLGEEKFNELKILNSLKTPQMLPGEERARDDAFQKLEFMKIFDANKKMKEDEQKAKEDAIKQAENDSKRVEQLKQNELDKLEEERILLDQGKEAAHAFNLEKQGLSKADAENIAKQQSELDGQKKKSNPDVRNSPTELRATESRLLTRGSEDASKFTAQNTAQATIELKALNVKMAKAEERERFKQKQLAITVLS